MLSCWLRPPRDGELETVYEIGRRDSFELLVIGKTVRDTLWILRAADGRRAVFNPYRNAP